MIRNYFRVIYILIEKIVIGNTQPAHNVLGTSPEGLLKVLKSETCGGLSGDSREPIQKLMILWKNCISEVIVLVLDICKDIPSISVSVFYRKNKYSKALNGYVHRRSTGPSCETSLGLNDGTFYERQWDTSVKHVF